MKLKSLATTETALTTGIQVAVIDTRLKDYQQIVAALSPTMKIVLLDSNSDGLAVIANALSEFSDVTALHLFSHASPASMQLGASYLNAGTISTSTSLAALTSIGSSLTEDGVILLYGCDLADGDNGQEFISQFASLTGVTVGASSNTTGAAALGGDWQMEVIATSNGAFLQTHAGVQDTANAVALSLHDYQQSLTGLITATNQVSIATGNDYIHTTPGATPLATLGAVELDNGSRVLLQANNKADYYGSANLDYLSVVVIDSVGNKTTINLSGTVATVINDNGGASHNSNSIQTNDAASIIALTTGGFVVSSYSDGGYGVQLYNNAGVSQSITAPATYTSSDNPSAKVLASQDGGFVLLWTSTNLTTNVATASYQRYTSSGSLSGSTYSKAFASTTPVVQNAAIDQHGNIAIPISSNDVYTHSQVLLWSAANVEVGTFNTAYYQSAAVIAPMYGGGFDLFGNDISSGVGNTANYFHVQTLGADGSLGLTVASAVPVANLRSVALSLSGDYLAVGGATDTAELGYFVDGFNPGAGTTTQSIADADKVASIPSLSDTGNIVSAWITNPVTNANDLVTSGAVSVVTYVAAFTTPVDYPPTIAGTFTTSGALTDKTNILPFANLTVSDVDSAAGKVKITYTAANGSLSGTGLSGTAGNYVLETATTTLATLTSELRALVFTPTENQIVPNSTVQTTFTITPADSTRDGRANTATNAITTSINDAPVINNNGSAASANTTAAENQTAVMTFTTSDPDVGQSITYSKSGADAALFTIHPTTGVLTFTTAPNFEIPTDAGGDNVYNVTITSSDGLASDTQAIAVTVTNVNENPVITSNGGGASANINAAENQLAVTVVAAGDVDAGTTLTYSVSGTDSALFDINSSNGTLTFKATPNFEAPTDNGGNNIYNVVVTASDGSLTDTQALAITVTNVNDAPTISGISSADNQTVAASASPALIDIATAATVTDEDNANFNGGNLTVSFGSGRQAGDSLAIRAGAGVTLSNSMAVASSITIEGQVIGSIAASGTGAGSDNLIVSLNAQATLTRISTLLQNLTFDATGTAGDRLLDVRVNDGAANSNTASLTISVTTNPTVEVSTSAGPLKAGDTAVIHFQFSETPVGFTESDISVSGGTISNLTVDGGDNKIYTALFTPATDTQSVSGSVSIGAGTFTNAGAVSNIASTVNASLTGDTLAPSVANITRASTTPTNATSVSFTVTFAESVTGVGASDFSVNTTGATTGTLASVSGSGTTYTVTVNSVAGEGTLRLDLNSSLTGIIDSLSNPISGGFTSGEVYTIDKTAPTISSITALGASPNNATSDQYLVTFSESVTGVDIADFALTTTGTAGGTIASVSGSGSTRTVTINSVTGAGTIRLDSNASGTGIADTATNALSGVAFTSGDVYTVDTVAPTVSSIVRVGSATTNATSISYTVTFSESVTGVDTNDFTLTATGSASGTIQSCTGSGTTYTVTVNSVSGDGTLRLDLNNSGTAIVDALNNAIAAGYTSGNTITIDNTAPNAPSTPDLEAASDSGSSSTDNVTTDDTPTISGTSEPNAVVTIYDSNGTSSLGSITADGSGNWTITSSSLTNGPHTITAKAVDSVGNTSIASGGLVVTIANPTITDATYDASNGLLTVTGTDMNAGDTIAVNKLSITGQGGASYILTTSDVTTSSATSFSVTLSAADQINVNGLLNKDGASSVGGTTFNLAGALNWETTAGSSADLTGNVVTVSNVTAPTISSATYNASTHVLSVSGAHLVKTVGLNNDITVTKLSLKGEGATLYTLTSTDVEVTNANSFSVTLNASDRAQLEPLFNKSGLQSTGGTIYNLSAADDWNSVIGNTDISDTSNAVTVSNVATPTINSATYDASTGQLVITGTGFSKFIGGNNDVDVTQLIVRGEGGSLYAPSSSADVEITSNTSFSVTLSADDKEVFNSIINKNGLTATGGSTYSIQASDNFIRGADAALDISGSQMPMTTTNVAVPTVTSASYDVLTGVLTVTGTGLSRLDGSDNDIIANKLTFKGEGNTTYTLTDTSDVDMVNTTSFTMTVSATDKAGLAALFNKDGLSSTGGTVYNLAAAEDWDAAADVSVTIADLLSNPITVTGHAPTTTITNSSFSADAGTLNNDFITNVASQTISGNLSANLASGEFVEVSVNNGSSWATATATVGQSTWSLSGATLDTGTTNFKVRVSNGSATGPTYSQVYTLDTDAPTATISTASFSADTGSSPTDFITNTAAQTISGTLSANMVSGDRVQVSLDNGGTWQTASTTVGQNTWSLAGVTLSAGTDTLKVRVVDTAGNASTTFSHSYTLDQTVPTASSTPDMTAASDSGSSNTDNQTNLRTPTFSGTAEANAIVTLYDTDGISVLGVDTADGSGNWEITSNLLGTGPHIVTTKVTDAAGNTGPASSALSVNIDTTAPTLATTITLSDTTLTVGETATVTFTFNEPVTGLDVGDVTAPHANLHNFSSADGGTTWTATLTPNLTFEGSTNALSLDLSGIADLAGNAGVGSANSVNYAIDTLRPTSSIAMNDTALRIGETATVTFTFSEAVTNFTTADVTVSNGTLTGLTTANGGVTWTATFTPASNFEGASNTITLNNTTLNDLAGNAGTGNTVSANYSIDTLAPVAPSIPDLQTVSDSGVSTTDNRTNISTPSFSGTAEIGAQVQIYDGATQIGSTTANGSGIWNFTSPSLLDGVHNISAKAVDLAGNVGPASAALATTIDTVKPALNGAITISDTALTAGETATVTFNFTEAVTGFTTADVTVANGTLSGLTTANGGLSWTATLTPATNQQSSTNVITLDHTGYTDIAGNAGTGSTTTGNYTVDTVRPTATISINDTNLLLGETAQVSFSFNRTVTGFTNSDLTIENGTLSAVTSVDGGLNWSATFTPTALVLDTTNVISLNLAGVNDTVAGNAGIGNATSANYIVDTRNTAPVISGTVAGQAVNSNATIAPFATVTIADPDLGATVRAQISLDAAKGSFTTASLALSGFSTSNGGASYSHAYVSPADLQQALRALVFQPNPSRVAVGNTDTTTFNLSVSDGIAQTNNSSTTVVATAINQAPTDISLSRTQIGQSAGALATLGSLSTTDVNVADTHTYALVNSGINDNALFTLVGNVVKVNAPAQTAAGKYTLAVRSTDASGASVLKSFDILVTDDAGPKVSFIKGTRSATHPDEVIYTVRFSEEVKGVGLEDFNLLTLGGATGTINSVDRISGTTYQVKIDHVGGNGSLRLDLINDASITDLDTNLIKGFFAGQEISIAPDDDQDNVSDALESLVPNRFGTGKGDGNGDNIADVTQRDVSSLIWQEQPTGSPSYVTLSNNLGVTQTNVITHPTPSTLPAGVNMPFGLLSFNLMDVTPGASVTMSVFVDKSIDINGYWKQNKEGTWVNIAETFNRDGNSTKMTFTLTDGGEFDTDGVVNGKISDPGGPGYFAAASLSMETFALPELAPRNAKNLDFLVSFNTAVKNIDASDFSISGTGTAQGMIKQITKVNDTTYKVSVDGVKGDGTLAVTTKSAAAGNDITDAFGSVLNNALSTTVHPLQNDITLRSNSEKVAALYTLMYHRAPDQAGLTYWLNEMAQGKTMTDISRAFAGNARFTNDYASLSNQQFVEIIYIEGLGNAGDAQGVGYWTQKLNSGQSRSDLLADFALATITADLVKAHDGKTLTDTEYMSAVARQNALLNRIDLGLEFVKQFGSSTNPMAASDLDPAYHAAQLVIANVGPSDQSLHDSLNTLHQMNNINNLLQIIPSNNIGLVGLPADTIV